ncbi:MAG: hypothetical protein ACFB9N_15005 [Geitlerinemataceae cyanobacterium]
MLATTTPNPLLSPIYPFELRHLTGIDSITLERLDRLRTNHPYSYIDWLFYLGLGLIAALFSVAACYFTIAGISVFLPHLLKLDWILQLLKEANAPIIAIATLCYANYTCFLAGNALKRRHYAFVSLWPSVDTYNFLLDLADRGLLLDPENWKYLKTLNFSGRRYEFNDTVKIREFLQETGIRLRFALAYSRYTPSKPIRKDFAMTPAVEHIFHDAIQDGQTYFEAFLLAAETQAAYDTPPRQL